MQYLSYLGYIALVSTWFRMELPKSMFDIRRSSHLAMPTKYEYLTGNGFRGVDLFSRNLNDVCGSQ